MEFLSRNWGLIPAEVQEKIKNAKVLIVGCGVGSLIALLATRTGFANFELWDGDTVEIHNLNRQPFDESDLGKNKAKITAQKIKAINPRTNVKVYPEFLVRDSDIVTAVQRAAFVINMADPDEAMWKISETSRNAGKVEIQVLNVGWMSYCLVLTPSTPSLEEICGGRFYGYEYYSRLVEGTVGKNPLPKEILEKVIKENKPFPQLGVTTYLNAALTVTAMIRWIEEDPTLPVAPRPLTLELPRG